MEIKVNGSSIEELHNSLCESSLNATDLSQRMCDVADVQIDMAAQGIDLLKEYFITVLGML